MNIINDGYRTKDLKNAFEWWYFDFDIQSGERIYIEWHSPIFNLRNNKCLLVVRAHENEKLKTRNFKNAVLTKAYSYHRLKVKQSVTECRIEFPAGKIYQKGSDYCVNIDEKGLFVNLFLKNEIIHQSQRDEVLYKSELDNKFFAWNVPLLRAQAQGQMKINDRVIEINAPAYHDHNWGNLSLSKEFKGWIWFRVFFKNHTFVMGDIFTQEKNHKIRPFIFSDKQGEILANNGLNIKYNGVWKNKFFMPKEIEISFSGKLSYRINMQVDDLSSLQEAPLGECWIPGADLFINYIYYCFRLWLFPEIFKKWLKLLLYKQDKIKATLYIDEKKIETAVGKIEVFSCEG